MEATAPRMRLVQLARTSLAGAFALSLLLHLMLFAVVELGQRAGWWRHSVLSSLLSSREQSQERVAENKPEPQTEVPIVFVEVDPAVATAEPPKETKYYSSQSSQAANPDATVDTGTPKISGTQELVARTLDQPRVQPEPLQPAAPPEPVAKQERTENQRAEPEPASSKPGELEMARASEKPDVSSLLRPPPAVIQEQPERRRPRRIAEALQQRGLLAGEKMKQEGGMKRFSIAEGLDVKAMPFGDYDGAIIAAIQQRWYGLLDERDYARGYTGKVVLTFRLNSDGRISELRVQENEVSDILALICQRAVLDPAPFAPWPSDMRRMIGADYREVRFTFHYN